MGKELFLYTRLEINSFWFFSPVFVRIFVMWNLTVRSVMYSSFAISLICAPVRIKDRICFSLVVKLYFLISDSKLNGDVSTAWVGNSPWLVEVMILISKILPEQAVCVKSWYTLNSKNINTTSNTRYWMRITKSPVTGLNQKYTPRNEPKAVTVC